MGRCLDTAPSPLSNKALQGTKILLHTNNFILGKNPEKIRQQSFENAGTKTEVIPPAHKNSPQRSRWDRTGRSPWEKRNVSKSQPDVSWSFVTDTGSKATAVFFYHTPRWARQKAVPPRLSQFHFPVVRHPRLSPRLSVDTCREDKISQCGGNARTGQIASVKENINGGRGDEASSNLLRSDQTPRPANRVVIARIEKPKGPDAENPTKNYKTSSKTETSAKCPEEREGEKTPNLLLRLEDEKKEVKPNVSEPTSPVPRSENKMNDQSECAANGTKQADFFWTESLPEEVRHGCCLYHVVREGPTRIESPKPTTPIPKRTAFNSDKALVRSVTRLSKHTPRSVTRLTKHTPRSVGRPKREADQVPQPQSSDHAHQVSPSPPRPPTPRDSFPPISPQLPPDATTTDARRRAGHPCSVINLRLDHRSENRSLFSSLTSWRPLLHEGDCSAQHKRRVPLNATNYLGNATADLQGDTAVGSALLFPCHTPDSGVQSDDKGALIPQRNMGEENNAASVALTSKPVVNNWNMSANLEYQEKTNTRIQHALGQNEGSDINSDSSEPSSVLKQSTPRDTSDISFASENDYCLNREEKSQMKGNPGTEEAETENRAFDQLVSNMQVFGDERTRCKNEFQNLLRKRGWENETRCLGISLHPGEYSRKGKAAPSWKWTSDPWVGRAPRALGHTESSNMICIRGRSVGKVWTCHSRSRVEPQGNFCSCVQARPFTRVKSTCSDFTSTCNPLDTGFCLPSRLPPSTDALRSESSLTETEKRKPSQSSSSIRLDDFSTKPKGILKNSGRHCQIDGVQGSDTVMTERAESGMISEMKIDREQSSEPTLILQDEAAGSSSTQEVCLSGESDVRSCFVESGIGFRDLKPRDKTSKFQPHYRLSGEDINQGQDLGMQELGVGESGAGLRGEGDSENVRKDAILCTTCRHVMKWVTATMDTEKANEWQSSIG